MNSALIVDDDAFMRSLTVQLLRRLDFEDCIEVADGREALDVLDTTTAKLVMIDLNMPGMDGLELLRHLSDRAGDFGIILFSGEDRRVLRTAEQLAVALRLPVLGTVSKPPSLDQLEPLVAKLPSVLLRGKPRGAPGEPLTADDIREGLKAGHLTLAYQPQVETVTGMVRGVEALARWDHPTRGLVGPWAFIPVAEREGLITELTRTVLELAIKQAADWQRRGIDLVVAANVTVEDLTDLGFGDVVVQLLTEYDLDPSRLMLEVTESRIMADVTGPMEILSRLRMRGIGLAIDDFGTGASSMEQLGRLPFTELKVDRQFVTRSHEDSETRALLTASLAIARDLGLIPLAEGVETEQEWAMVASLGCELVQGYLISPPLLAPRFEAWLPTWKGIGS